MSGTWKRGSTFGVGIRDGKISPVLWICVGGHDSVSSREKVEKTYMQL